MSQPQKPEHTLRAIAALRPLDDRLDLAADLEILGDLGPALRDVIRGYIDFGPAGPATTPAEDAGRRRQMDRLAETLRTLRLYAADAADEDLL